MWRNLGSRFSSTLVQHLRRNLICAQAEQREEEATLWKKTETETETDQAKDDVSFHLLESQGLALYDLALAPNFWRTHIDGSLLVKIIFLKENRGPYQSYGILKTGRPIQLCQEADGGKSEIIPGVISDVRPNHFYIHLKKISPFVLKALDYCSTIHSPENAVYIVRKKPNLNSRVIEDLRKALRERDDLKETEVIKKVLSEPSLHSECWTVEDKGEQQQPSPMKLPPQKLTLFNDGNLDASKRAALAKCAECEPVTILFGPPGTGKTTTLAAAVLSAVANGDRVLVTAPTNAACDAFARAILNQWPKELFGDPLSGSIVRAVAKSFTTRNDVVQTQVDIKKLFKMSKQYNLLMTELSEVRRELLSHLGKKKGQLLMEDHAIVAKIGNLLPALMRKALAEAKVVIATADTAAINSGIREMCEEGDFDLTCIDEACCLRNDKAILHLMRSRRVILSGDHHQLPPMIVSEKALEMKFDVSLMEQVAKQSPECVSMLTTQYRSNQLISSWSSQYFYNGLVTASPTVKDSLLQDLPNVCKHPDTAKALIFLDTKGENYEEDSDEDCEDSVANFNEAFVVDHVVQRYLAHGVKLHQMGVIAPYYSQVKVLQTLLKTGRKSKEDLVVATVDSFQGSEREMIILSLTRSNSSRVVGFLSETRRINVSITRAKKLCVVIGDSGTLSSDLGLRSFYNYCLENKAVIPVESFMSSSASYDSDGDS